MTATRLVESKLDPRDAIYSAVIPAGEPWMHEIRRGQFFRIVDLHGNRRSGGHTVEHAGQDAHRVRFLPLG